MSKIKYLEKRIRVLECKCNEGHCFELGKLIGNRYGEPRVELECALCGFRIEKFLNLLTEKEKRVAEKLRLI